MTQKNKNQLLRALPSVDHLMGLAAESDAFNAMPRRVVLGSVRKAIDLARKQILETGQALISEADLLKTAQSIGEQRLEPRLKHLINATGVVLHTNLGRALLCEEALDNIRTVARSYSNLEFNLAAGQRGIRYEAVEELICELTGAEAAMAVNNNAGAVLLALSTLAPGREGIVSRGELVEIGGSFRIPDVMARSGCILKEVGATNRTHLKDYEAAITQETGLLLKVHASNYRIQGFTASVGLPEMVALGQTHGIPVMEDLGSGTLIDFSKYGLPAEPTVADSVAAGTDVVTFSGDKLLGGPQAGIIVGSKAVMEQIKANPLTRALRIDKLTLAALEATLKHYRDEDSAIRKIPTLRMLTMDYDTTCKQAETLMAAIRSAGVQAAQINFADLKSRPGGGSFPELELPTRCIGIKPETLSCAALEKQMRLSSPAVIGRIENDQFILDPRTVQAGQETIISLTLARILARP